MLKRLAILGLLVMSCGAWSQVPGNGGSQHDKAQDKEETANPPKPVVVVEGQHPANNQEQAPEQSAKYPWGELYAPANVPNWFLVIIAGITGWFVYKTLRAIKKQADIMESQAKDARESGAEATRIALATAKAAQKSADATAAQIEFMKSKERAQLRMDIDVPSLDFISGFREQPGGYQLIFSVILDGTTRAYVLEDSFIAYISDQPKEKRVRPVIGLPRNLLPESSPIRTYTLLQTDGLYPEVETDNQKVISARQGKLGIFVNGRIWYRDIFGDEWILEIDRYWDAETRRWGPVGSGRHDTHYKVDTSRRDEYLKASEQRPDPN
jgi:hypothetical protein